MNITPQDLKDQMVYLKRRKDRRRHPVARVSARALSIFRHELPVITQLKHLYKEAFRQNPSNATFSEAQQIQLFQMLFLDKSPSDSNTTRALIDSLRHQTSNGHLESIDNIISAIRWATAPLQISDPSTTT